MTPIKFPQHIDWYTFLENNHNLQYLENTNLFFKNFPSQRIVYPSSIDIFNAFKLCSFKKCRVIIIGQDPYHNPGQAHGLAFSVQQAKLPPSLKNIFKEIYSDLGIQNIHGDLSCWAKQGVLLINSILTVTKNQPGSHQKAGWQAFTDSVIQTLSEEKNNLVFLLWGRYAQEKKVLIDESKHLVLEAAHPSPFSAHRGFYGCKHFSKTNAYLQKTGQETIDWSVGPLQGTQQQIAF